MDACDAQHGTVPELVPTDSGGARMVGVPTWRAGRSAFDIGSVGRTVLRLRDRHFTAMGCECQIVVLGGDDAALGRAEAHVRRLEAVWTRFSADSELSAFNRADGRWRRVSAELSVLLWRGLAGFRLSGGLFNPFLGEHIQQVGYDRDFSLLDARSGLNSTVASEENPALAESVGSRVGRKSRPHIGAPALQFRCNRQLARLVGGGQFDSGGIGKGLGAQIVAQSLVATGVAGTMVSLGGDVAVAGAYPDQGWRIGVADPLGADTDATTIVLREGSICTSSVVKRRWRSDDGTVSHHILDPVSGVSLVADRIVGVTAISRQGWRSEVMTKAALIGGPLVARRIVSRVPGSAVILWDGSGQPLTIQ